VNKDRTAAVSHLVTSDFSSMGKPTWSRDGSQLVFTMQLPGGQTYVAMDAFSGGGMSFKGITNGYENLAPAWSR
jgi:hypothetical protein